MTAPDHEQAERSAKAMLAQTQFVDNVGWGQKMFVARAYLNLAAQLAEAQEQVEASQQMCQRLQDENGLLNRKCAAAEAQLAERERALEQIADPSYVGNYSPEEVVAIYRKWARTATHSDSEREDG